MSEIRIENLNKKIKGSVILDDISLTMTPGRDIWTPWKEWLWQDNAYESYMWSAHT